MENLSRALVVSGLGLIALLIAGAHFFHAPYRVTLDLVLRVTGFGYRCGWSVFDFLRQDSPLSAATIFYLRQPRGSAVRRRPFYRWGYRCVILAVALLLCLLLSTP